MALCCSDNEELFSEDCEDVEDAIQTAIDKAWGAVYVGTKVTQRWSDLLPRVTEEISELASIQAGEKAGEAAEGWPSFTEKQGKELEYIIRAAVDAWADKHGLQPQFYYVKDVKQHDLPSDEAEDGSAP